MKYEKHDMCYGIYGSRIGVRLYLGLFSRLLFCVKDLFG